MGGSKLCECPTTNAAPAHAGRVDQVPLHGDAQDRVLFGVAEDIHGVPVLFDDRQLLLQEGYGRAPTCDSGGAMRAPELASTWSLIQASAMIGQNTKPYPDTRRAGRWG
jgi:hypothetical protein